MRELYRQYVTEQFDSEGVLCDFTIRPTPHFNFGYDVIDEIAKEEPKRRALVWCNPKGEEKTFTFGEISRLSNQAANFLLEQGIHSGDCVLLMLKRHYEWWYILPALHKIGAIAVPATHMLTAKDIIYRVQAASIRAAIFTPQSGVPEQMRRAQEMCPQLQKLFMVRGVKPGMIDMTSGIAAASDQLERIDTSADDPLLAYFTSGTTGYPKMVVHPHTYPLAHILTAKYWQNVQPDDLHLTVAETGWGKAVWGKIYGQWFLGAAVMVYDFDKFVPYDLLDVIEKYRVSTFCAPPTIYRFFMKEGLGGHDLSTLRYAVTAGEALNFEIIKQFEEATGLTIREAYGQTETTCILVNLVGAKTKQGSMGKASPLYYVDLIDEAGNSVPDGEVGEICLRLRDGKPQIGLFSHYHNAPKLNAYAWRGGLYHTGDTATRDSDGYFWYVGRADDIIKSSGYRIGPFEVESVLMEHPAVLECGVTGEPDAVRGQVVKATVVLTSAYSPSDELAQELKDYVKHNTAPYKYPRVIEFVDELPKTISGKIQRNILRGEGQEGK